VTKFRKQKDSIEATYSESSVKSQSEQFLSSQYRVLFIVSIHTWRRLPYIVGTSNYEAS
jgi:hypothetical protein